MSKILVTLVFSLLSIGIVLPQADLKPLDEQAYSLWKNIKNPKLSNNGNWVCYQITPDFGDGRLAIYNQTTEVTKFVPRAFSPAFDHQDQILAFKVKPPKHALDSLMRQNVCIDSLPGDTLCIMQLTNQTVTKYAPVSEFVIPEEWGSVFFLIDSKSDTSWSQRLPRKMRNDEEILMHLNLQNGQIDTFLYALEFELAKKDPYFLVAHRTQDSIASTKLEWVDLTTGKRQTLIDQKCTIEQISIDNQGQSCAYIANFDTLNLTQNRQFFLLG